MRSFLILVFLLVLVPPLVGCGDLAEKPIATSTEPTLAIPKPTQSTPTPLPALSIQLVNQDGSSEIESTDSLSVTIIGDNQPLTNYQYKWYRNGILMSNAKDAVLTNDEMKTFRGLPEEYTPPSSHKDHTIRGYEFKVEVFKQGDFAGESKVEIEGLKTSVEMRGINFPTFGNDAYLPTLDDREYRSMENMVSSLHPNWTSVWALYFMESGNSPKVYPKFEGEPQTLFDADIIDQINAAHKLGLKVVLDTQIWWDIPGQVAVPDLQNLIEPSDAWFDSYKEVLIHRAEIAESTGVELLVIGDELESTHNRTDKWLELIKVVRENYSGPITYGPIGCHPEWSQHLEQYSWFSELDYIGVTANIEIPKSTDYDPTLSFLINSFNRCAEELEYVSKHFEKPVIILEAGVPGANGAVFGPGEWDQTTFDYQEQADWFDAVLNVFGNQPWVKGIFLLQWLCYQDIYYTLHPDELVIDNNPSHIAFIFRPTERIIKSWYIP